MPGFTAAQNWVRTTEIPATSVYAVAELNGELYAATDGSGVYLLNLANPTSWKPFNSGRFQFGACSIICSDHTLVACIGSYVFTHRQGVSQWMDAIADTLQGRLPLTLYRHGDDVFLGTTGGIYKSDFSAMGWQRADIRAQPNHDISTFAAQGTLLFAGLDYRAEHWIWSTENQGDAWDIRSHEYAYLYTLFPSKSRMWAGRTDGLWLLTWAGGPALLSALRGRPTHRT